MKQTILVTGDVVVDHHLYEGQRRTASAIERRGVKVVREHGGAKALTRLIAAVIARATVLGDEERQEREESVQSAEHDLAEAKRRESERELVAQAEMRAQEAREGLAGHKPPPEAQWVVDCPLTLPPEHAVPCGHHALALWKPFPEEPTGTGDRNKVWRADLLMGYGHDELPADGGPLACRSHTPQLVSPPPATPKLLVFDDAGFVFRHRACEQCWLLPTSADGTPEWIILKMSAPVCQGDLWHRLAEAHSQRLIVVVSANELRQEPVRMGSGLSWERTVEELHEALRSNPVLQKLASIPRHLVVTFSADGALWLNNTGPEPRATLIFDAGGAEGAWARPIQGEAFGYLSCMVAALVRSLMRNSNPIDLAPAIRAGLATMRNLRKRGHGPVSEHMHPASGELPAGFPAQRLAEVIVGGSSDFATLPVPWTECEWAPYAASPEILGQGRLWRIVEMSQSPFGSDRLPSLLGLATQTVLQGEAAIGRLPHARFGKLLTADRLELEALRTLERLMVQYREEKAPKRPLSIGVFGPPGAGKSFGVRQLADSVYGERAWREFNLSQFKDEEDLIGAFHQIRDAVLSGLTPVAFWDEFDSREYHWLQYLLAPMQDGRFQEGQVNHAIGKCVFVFAGATSDTFEAFGPPRRGHSDFAETASRTFALRKGPDFHSRLDTYYNVLGPNQRTVEAGGEGSSRQRVLDARDVCAPLRRALLIRALLGVPRTARVDFDADLLMALLRVPEYRHGARSVEKLIQSLKPSGEGRAVRRSALPPPAQLAMHIDPQSFGRILDENISFRQDEVIDALAPAIHETWRRLSTEQGWKMQPHLDKPYAELAPVDQEDNRAAARRIPAILALAGLNLEKLTDSTAPKDNAICRHLKHHLERLAEAEHDGWVEHRLRNGWRLAKQRDDVLKQHPALVPYAELSEADQQKDRSSVRAFPAMVKLAGYRIMWA